MKSTRVIIIFTIIIGILFMQGCKEFSVKNREKVVPPRNKNVPIKGTWNIIKYKKVDEKDNLPRFDKKMDGRQAVFDEGIAIFADEKCYLAQYKIKTVNTKEFFLYQYKVKAEDLGVYSQDVQVISITSNDKPFYDFIKTSDTTMIVYSDGIFYYLKKVSDDPKNIPKNNHRNVQEDQKIPSKRKHELLRSGVLLGLRSSLPDKPADYFNDKTKIAYRTLWISSNNKVLNTTLETNDLFVPRKTGFWNIWVETYKVKGFIQDMIHAQPAQNGFKGKPAGADKTFEKESVRRIINFVGNDYISTENISMDENTDNYLNEPRVLPIDNVNLKNGINITDITGQAGSDIFANSAQAFKVSRDKDIAERLESPPSEDKFMVARRNGHWILKGRLNYSDPLHITNYMDFNINVIPSAKLVNYDELCVSWSDIKARIPDALDAYTSPNDDLLVALTNDYIYIYTLEGGVISAKPMQKIELYDGESVVMAEWATGSYVYKWGENFEKLNPKIIGNNQKNR